MSNVEGTLIGGPDCGKSISISEDINGVHIPSSHGCYIRTEDIDQHNRYVWLWKFGQPTNER